MPGERIVLLGAGRVATQLARALSLWPSEGQRLQLYSPGGHSARRLAAKLTGEVSVARSLSELDKDADCYIFAVPDTVIASLASELAELGVGTAARALWAHVSGATPLAHLAEHHSESAVLYPCRPSPRSGSRTSVRYRFIWRGIRPWRVKLSKPWGTD